MTSSSGRFVVLEGIDGSGTTTQVRRLVEECGRRFPGRRVHATAEPSQGPVGQLIRQVLRGRVSGLDVLGRAAPYDPTSLALLFAADRMDHLAVEVTPLVREGWLVLSDRYLWSSLAYQSLEVPEALIREANAMAPDPDLVVMLEVPPEVAIARLRASRAEREVYEDPGILERVAQAYRRAFQVRPPGNLLVLDGTLPAPEVTSRVMEAILPLMG